MPMENTVKNSIHFTNFVTALGPVGQRISVQKEKQAVRDKDILALGKHIFQARAKALADLPLAAMATVGSTVAMIIKVPVGTTAALVAAPLSKTNSKKCFKWGVKSIPLPALHLGIAANDVVAIFIPELTARCRTDKLQRKCIDLRDIDSTIEKTNRKCLQNKLNFRVRWDEEACKMKIIGRNEYIYPFIKENRRPDLDVVLLTT